MKARRFGASVIGLGSLGLLLLGCGSSSGQSGTGGSATGGGGSQQRDRRLHHEQLGDDARRLGRIDRDR